MASHENDVNSQEIANLNCALSTIENKHLCQGDIPLECGHHICGNCFIFESNNNNIKCNICNRETDSSSIDSIIDQNLNKLFEITHKLLKTKLTTWKDRIHNRNEKIDNHIEFMKDEILIKIESLKSELDKFYEFYDKELEEIRIQWKEESKINEIDRLIEAKYETEINELQKKIKIHENLNRESLYYYQNEINLLQDTLDEYKSNYREWKFIESETVISQALIGKLVSEIELENNIVNRIENMEYRGINLESTFYDMCVLPDGKLLLMGYSELLLYDKNMDLLRKIARVGDYGISVFMCCIHDGNENIFLTSLAFSIIVKADLDFNQIAVFDNGEGSESNQLDRPLGICYYNEQIFVCDTGNQRIQKLDSNLVYKSSYDINIDADSPYYIKNINNIAMVRTYEYSICFYDLNNFNSIMRYNYNSSIIGVSRANFYSYNNESRKLSCYNLNGQLYKNIQTNDLGLIQDFYGSIVSFNSRLFILAEQDLCII